MKIITLLLMVIALSGCASLQNAGSSAYTLKPFITNPQTGATVCCEVTVSDGKERASLTLNISKVGENYYFSMDEKGVAAFQGQEIAAGATKDAIASAAKTAALAILAPIIPSLLPAAGAALSSPGIGAAAVGAGAALEGKKLIGGQNQ